jgi:hypothetical protein
MKKIQINLETNLVTFQLRRTGAALMLVAEAAKEGPSSFNMTGVLPQRFRFEHDVLIALQRAGIGSWSEFPQDNIQATVTRDQLKALGFKGIY